MENRIIALVAEHLLNEQFRSKKQMANALGLQYRTLLTPVLANAVPDAMRKCLMLPYDIV